MKELWELYTLFARIGAVTFGGGYAMLPLLTREFVDRRHWVTDEEMTDYYAIGQCTPGIIAINVSTFIGNKRKGIAGGIAATVGFVTVPLIVILVLAAFLRSFADLPLVQDAFAGVRVCVCVLILNAILRLWKHSVVDALTLGLFLLVFALSAFTSLSPVPLIVGAALFTLVIGSIRASKGGGRG